MKNDNGLSNSLGNSFDESYDMDLYAKMKELSLNVIIFTFLLTSISIFI